VRYDEGGLHVTVLKYAAGVAPSSVVAGPCSISQAIGFGAGAGGQYVACCFDGHGTLQLNLYSVETFFSYENASGEYDHGVNAGAPCNRVQDFGEFASFRYSPPAKACWVEL
jgi:hypothetical protein